MAGEQRSEREWATLRIRGAIRNRETEEVVRLLALGADPNVATGWTSPLSSAAGLGRVDVIEVLLAHGADPAWTNRSGWSAATFADAEERDEIAEELIAAGAPASSRFAHGYTELHRAARRGDPALAAVLRSSDHPVDVVDAEGATPLDLAIRHRHEAAAATMLDAGADPDRVYVGWSVLCAAVYEDSVLGETTDFIGLLLAHGANVRPAGYPPTFQTVNQEGCSGAVLRRLVEAGADITTRTDHDGETILHRIVAIVSDADLVDVALDIGAELDPRDHEGRTPLLLAALAPNAPPFLRLVERGADTAACDSTGRSLDDLLPADPEGDALRAVVRPD